MKVFENVFILREIDVREELSGEFILRGKGVKIVVKWSF